MVDTAAKLSAKKKTLTRIGTCSAAGTTASAQVIVEEARQRGQEQVGEEPGERLAHAEEQHRTDRRQQAPEADAAGGDEVADAPLHDEGREEEERQLRIAEEGKIARSS